jgi:hypothetical protein
MIMGGLRLRFEGIVRRARRSNRAAADTRRSAPLGMIGLMVAVVGAPAFAATPVPYQEYQAVSPRSSVARLHFSLPDSGHYRNIQYCQCLITTPENTPLSSPVSLDMFPANGKIITLYLRLSVDPLQNSYSKYYEGNIVFNLYAYSTDTNGPTIFATFSGAPSPNNRMECTLSGIDVPTR